jgi:Predicted exporters of the RND superfamily
MKKLFIISLLLLPVLLVLIFVFGRMKWKFSRTAQPSASESIATNTTVITTPVPALRTTNVLLGETILRGYADPNLPAENDLTLMSRLMENSLLLLKSAANRPLSANEDWADLFRGKNAAREEFLPAQHIALNAQGQLIDRWQRPLFFHALGGGRFEIRSAGPDGVMWTEDDIQRNANGTFARGTNTATEATR